MIEHSYQNGRLSFRVRVVPRASRSEIVGEHDGALRVRIAAPPVDGAANEELIHTLARALRVSKGNVEITSGHSGKIKQVTISGGPETLAALSKFFPKSYEKDSGR